MQNNNNNNNNYNNNKEYNPIVLANGLIQYSSEDSVEQLKDKFEIMVSDMAHDLYFPVNCTIHLSYVFINDLNGHDPGYFCEGTLYPELRFNYTTMTDESLKSLAAHHKIFQNDPYCEVISVVHYTINGVLPNYKYVILRQRWTDIKMICFSIVIFILMIVYFI